MPLRGVVSGSVSAYNLRVSVSHLWDVRSYGSDFACDAQLVARACDVRSLLLSSASSRSPRFSSCVTEADELSGIQFAADGYDLILVFNGWAMPVEQR